LVVIAIISILAGLLLPALHNANDSATELVCQNQLKQIGVGTLAYVNDFDALMPVGRYTSARKGYLRDVDYTKSAFCTLAVDYMGGDDASGDPDFTNGTDPALDSALALRFYSTEIFHCPFNPADPASSGDVAKGRVINTKGSGYGLYCGSALDLKMTVSKAYSIQQKYRASTGRDVGSTPALFADFSDTGQPGANNNRYSDSNHRKAGAPDEVATEAEGLSWIDDSNVLHLDGHVRRYSVAPAQAYTWEAYSWCRTQSGSLTVALVNPSTAVLPSTGGDGMISSSSIGMQIGPFSTTNW
jgi:prepilin-type processing-associated H-X9-DG protein